MYLYCIICIATLLYVLLSVVLSWFSDQILQGEAGAGASRCAVSWYLRPHRTSCYGNQQPGPGMESAESIGELSVPNPSKSRNIGVTWCNLVQGRKL